MTRHSTPTSPYTLWRALKAMLCVGLLFLGGFPAAAQAAAAQKYMVLCYHSVPALANGDPGAISAANLAEQLSWLRNSGYTAISMNDVLQAQAGLKPLPERSFMLTVDDGFEDFYTNAFPILKIYQVPAVFGLVGRWIEEPGVLQNETDKYFRQQRFVTWAQVKEMADSGLVEMASHTYDLHHGILANPQGNLKAAATTLQFDAVTQSYETPEQFRLRVRTDLEKNSALIAKYTGKAPRIMVWPYGSMDRTGVEEAARVGMPINFTLLDGSASTTDTEAVQRTLVGENMPLKNFSHLIKYGNLRKSGDPVRAIKLNLDRIYDPDPIKQDEKLGRLIDQTARLGINMVLLQPFATPGPDGAIREVYFPNAIVPMRSDLLNRAAWQLRSRLEVDVFMLINPTNFSRLDNGVAHRLDPATPQDRADLLTLHDALSRHATAQGLVFDGAPQDAAQISFNEELVKHMNYYRPLTLSSYAEGGQAMPVATRLPTGDHLLDERYGLFTLPAPVNASPPELAAFVRSLSPDQANLLTLPVKNASPRQLDNVLSKVRVLQHQGVADFLLDSDDFFDDPTKFALIRKAISLKDNPLLLTGK